MTRLPALAALALAATSVGACTHNDYGYGYSSARIGYSSGYYPRYASYYEPRYYGWYDGYYGSIHDGYWDDGGTFYFRLSTRDRWRRDDGRHFYYGEARPGRHYYRYDRANWRYRDGDRRRRHRH